MRILHYEHMGVGIIISKALQKLGVDSKVLASAPHPFGFTADFLFAQSKLLRGPIRRLYRRKEWNKYFEFDILHSHDHIQLPEYVVDHFDKKIIQHYHGPTISNPLYENIPSFVSLPNLIDIIPDSTWIPLPVDTDIFRKDKDEEKDAIRIGFSNQTVDPSKMAYIPKKSIEIVKKKYSSRIVLKPITKIISHEHMREYYSNIDIWVDRIGLNFYGFSAVEAASMNIPIITQIGENEEKFVPNCPFISASMGNVIEYIEQLIEDDQLREALGRKSREYVIKVHDSLHVAKLCKKKYEEVMADEIE